MTPERRSAPFALAGLLAALVCVPAAAQSTKPARAKAAAAVAPVQSAAHSAAEAAYRHHGRKEYAEAAEQAEQAVRLAPERRDYWLLLAQSRIGAGQIAQAQEALDRASAVAGDNGALGRVRSELQQARATTAGRAMYQALAANDFQAAILHGRSLVALQPEHAGHRVVLAHTLLRAGQFAEAERLAGEAGALGTDTAVPLALRAYARQMQGKSAEATADIDRALASGPPDLVLHRQLRMLAADLALAQGDGARATRLLDVFPPDDAESAGRRDYARQGAALPPLQTPGMDCSTAAGTAACKLQTAALPANPGHAAATAAYRAMEQKDFQVALEQARKAIAASPRQRDWQLLLLEAAAAAGQPEEAERAATAAIALRSDASLLARRSALRRGLGQTVAANADAEAALQAGGLPPAAEAGLLADLGRHAEARARLGDVAAQTNLQAAARLELAYVATRVGDDRTASAEFQRADAGGGLPPTSLLDAGYAAQRAAQDNAAIGYFSRAVDANTALTLKLDPQLVYDTRRNIADLSRRWGVLASVTSRNAGGVAPAFGAVGGPPGQRTTQVGAEAYWRPWGYRNGRFVELFARGFETLHSEAGGLEGGDSFQGALGARWKPLSAHNLVLSLSRTFGPNVADDWLAQVAYSLDRGGDLRVDSASWWTTRLAAEAGHYFSASSHYGLASLTFGRSFLVGEGGRTVVMPHGVVAYEYNSTSSPRSAAGAGPGVSVRHWFREDTYKAPQSYVDVSLQYRARLSGDDRLQGPHLGVVVSY